MTLPYVLEGESRPPCEETDIPLEQRREKEGVAFGNAMDILSRYWNISYVGFPVKPRCVESPQDSDNEQLLQLGKCTQGKLVSDTKLANLREEYKFLLRYCVRRRYQVDIYKCD